MVIINKKKCNPSITKLTLILTNTFILIKIGKFQENEYLSFYTPQLTESRGHSSKCSSYL